MPAALTAAPDAEQVQDDRQHQHHGEVGGKEQHDAFHGKPPGLEMG
jgi:hypothetical protein